MRPVRMEPSSTLCPASTLRVARCTLSKPPPRPSCSTTFCGVQRNICRSGGTSGSSTGPADISLYATESRAAARLSVAYNEISAGPVEDPDVPPLRQIFRCTPQKVVLQLGLGGGFERVHLATLRVDAGHNVLDGSILTGRIHGLEDQQH